MTATAADEVREYIRKPSPTVWAIRYNGRNAKQIYEWIKQYSPQGEAWWMTRTSGAGSTQAWKYAKGEDQWGETVLAAVYEYTHGEWLPVKKGEYIVRGVVGEFYPVSSEVFEQTFTAKDELR